jgi:hypothetical protein
MRRLAPLPLLLLGLFLGACASEGQSGKAGADPAAAVPAGAPLYVEVVARPGGDVRSGAEAALQKVLRTDDPGKRAQQLFDQLAGKQVKWADVSPWLGDRVGVFVTSIKDNGQGAVVFAVKDEGKARATLERLLHAKGAEKTYKDASYKLGDDSNAVGIAGDYAVLGLSEAGFKSVADVVAGAPALATGAAYRTARTAAAADAGLAFAYADTSGVVDMVAGEQALGGIATLLRGAVSQVGDTVAVALQADGKRIRIGGAALGGTPPAAGKTGADVVAALPGDAWLALGVGDLGKTLGDGLDAIGSLGQVGAVDVAAGLKDAEQKLGIDFKRDVTSWMGSGAIYARGTSLIDIGAVLTAETTDPAASRRGIARIARALARSGARVQDGSVDGYDTVYELHFSGLPLPIPFYLAANDERVSFGVNPDALSAVAHPADRLADSPKYRAATESLGDGLEPAMVLDLPTVLRLVEGFGVGNNPSYKKVKPYLDAFGVIAAGTRREGDTAKGALAVGLR